MNLKKFTYGSFAYYFYTDGNALGKDEYEFDVNKGYPVKKHIKAIEKFGRSKIHRVTFMK